MRALALMLAAIAALALPPRQTETGSLSGRVELVGVRPSPATSAPVLNPADAAVCGAHVAPQNLIVDDRGGVQNVVLYLDVPAEPVAPSRLTLTNRGCRFEPRVQTASVGSQLVVRNDDAILHNTHAYTGPDVTLFNVALPIKGAQVVRTLTTPGLVRFKCDAGHTWMSAYVMVVPHRFHNVSDANGRFRIESIPAGSYSLVVWHETLGAEPADVRIEAGREAMVEVKLKVADSGPSARR